MKLKAENLLLDQLKKSYPKAKIESNDAKKNQIKMFDFPYEGISIELGTT